MLKAVRGQRVGEGCNPGVGEEGSYGDALLCIKQNTTGFFRLGSVDLPTAQVDEAEHRHVLYPLAHCSRNGYHMFEKLQALFKCRKCPSKA